MISSSSSLVFTIIATVLLCGLNSSIQAINLNVAMKTQTFSSTFKYPSAQAAYQVLKTTDVMFSLQPFVYYVDIISQTDTSRELDFAEKIPIFFGVFNYDTGKLRAVQAFDNSQRSIVSNVPFPGGLGTLVANLSFTESADVDENGLKTITCNEIVNGQVFLLAKLFVEDSVKSAHTQLVADIANYFTTHPASA